MIPSVTEALVEVSAELAELVGTRLLDQTAGAISDAGYHLEAVLGIGGMGVAFLARAEPWSEPAVQSGELSETTLSESSRPGRPAPGARCVVKVLLPGVVLTVQNATQIVLRPLAQVATDIAR